MFMPSKARAGLPLSADRQAPKRSEGGYGLVVEHVLAKDETGVRFSLPAWDYLICLVSSVGRAAPS